MAKAVKCPVCGGTGKLLRGNGYQSTAIEANYQECHGCNGRGWVEVSY